jgi:hypothetical protein
MKAILALILATTAVTSQANEFQEVYEVPGKSAIAIVTAVATMVTKPVSKTENVIVVQAATRCKAGWGVNMDMISTVMVEAKDGRYRLTIKDTRTAPSEGINQPLMAMNPSFIEKCLPEVRKNAGSISQAINAYKDF